MASAHGTCGGPTPSPPGRARTRRAEAAARRAPPEAPGPGATGAPERAWGGPWPRPPRRAGTGAPERVGAAAVTPAWPGRTLTTAACGAASAEAARTSAAIEADAISQRRRTG